MGTPMRLIARQLTCVRGGRTIFAELDFEMRAGEALLLTGRNGAGKSSLLRLLAGLVRIAGGTVELEGGTEEAPLAEQAHYLGHQDALKPSMSVRENLAFWTDYLDGGGLDLQTALTEVGLGSLGHLPAAYLSAGQRRRLSLARLLTVKRPLWLLDEPTAALDTAAQTRLAELMEAHRANGGMIIAATHMPLGLIAPRELRLGEARPEGLRA